MRYDSHYMYDVFKKFCLNLNLIKTFPQKKSLLSAAATTTAQYVRYILGVMKLQKKILTTGQSFCAEHKPRYKILLLFT